MTESPEAKSIGWASRSSQPLDVPSAGVPRSAVERFEGLDAYRGIAALLVVVFHAYQYSRVDSPLYVYEGTWVHPILVNLDGAVSWFFVLSGFLIFLPFVRAAVWHQSSLSARGFLIRRAIRILPLYYVAILIVWTFRYTGGLDQWIDLVEHLTFTNIFDPVYIFWTIGPAWSLAVEVMFYFFVAIISFPMYRVASRLSTTGARIRLIAGFITIMIVASVIYKGWAFYVIQFPAENWPIYFGPMAKLDTFAMGMLLALVVAAGNSKIRLGGWTAALMRLVGIALLGLSFVFRKSDPLMDLYFGTLCGLGFLLILGSSVLAPRDSLWSKILAHPALQFLGLVSYSLYIWHEPIMIELGKRNFLIREVAAAFPTNAVVLAVLSLIVGAISYWVIEYPVLKLRFLFTHQGRLAERYAGEP